MGILASQTRQRSVRAAEGARSDVVRPVLDEYRCCDGLGGYYPAVVVTVGSVWVVQMSAHQVVNVLAVRYGVVPALPTVDVALLVRAARVGRRASGGIRLPGREDVLVDVPLVEMM